MRRFCVAAVVGCWCLGGGVVAFGAQPVEVEVKPGAEGGALSPFWIGAMCVPVEATLRAQFGLKDGQGLVAVDVMKDSPAAQAGLRRHDVIVAIDGRALEEVGQLVKAVNDSGEHEMKLEILREGKRQTLTVKPSRRPDFDPPADRRFPARMPDVEGMKDHARQMREHLERIRKQIPEAEIRRLEEWIERLERGEANHPLRMHLFGPGVVMQQMQTGGGLPAGVSVTITKENEGPAKIEVRRGDDKWNVTEDDLSKLPAELRGAVGGMLGGGAAAQAKMFAFPGGFGDGLPGPNRGNVKIVPRDGTAGDQLLISPALPEGARRQMQDELERMRRQIESLERQMKDLQRPGEPAKPAPKKNKPAEKA